MEAGYYWIKFEHWHIGYHNTYCWTITEDYGMPLDKRHYDTTEELIKVSKEISKRILEPWEEA